MNTITLVTADNATQLISPSKVICVGRNYVEHIKELDNEVPDEMVVFIKPNSSISQVLAASHNNDALHYEAELCFLYQQGKFNAVALGLDLTKRDVQSKLKSKGLPWERAKAFDGSATFSQFVAFDEGNINQLNLSLTINDKPTQQGGVPLMMFKPADILKELQQFLTLEDGDVVMTGTPKGVGVVNHGDYFFGRVYTTEENSTLVKSQLLEHQWQVK